MSVDVRTAVVNAENYLQSLGDLLGKDLENFRLEEVEPSEDKEFWYITIGYDRPVLKQKTVLEIERLLPQSPYQREYKIIKINAQTGEVESMKIRNL